MANNHALKYGPTELATDEALRQELVARGVTVSVPVSAVPAHWLQEGEYRLNAGYYANEAFVAERLLQESGARVRPLREVAADIFAAPISQRHFSYNGTPYLTPSDVFCFRPTADKFVVHNSLTRPDLWWVKRNWILVSQSGSVGRIALSTRRLEQFIVSQNLLRIIPNAEILPGYLYAFLASRLGQTLISKDQYGAAIKHLEPHHLAKIPVPVLPQREQQSIHAEILRAYELRDEANDLLDKADALLHNELGLPKFDDELVEYLPAPVDDSSVVKMPHPRAFSVNASRLGGRFDASYHVPVVETALSLLHKGKYEAVRLGHLAGRIFIPPRFKRIYVTEEHGVPFLQGSHIPLMKPYDLKYISKAHTQGLGRWIIEKGWVLVTCSGTIGRIGMVSSLKEGWAASQHILRIAPDDHKGHRGYLAAFLMTPYGQHQLTAKVYGGVVDELTEDDTASVWIPNAPSEVQAEIGELVVTAFENKDEASSIEEAAIRQLEMTLEQSAVNENSVIKSSPQPS